MSRSNSISTIQSDEIDVNRTRLNSLAHSLDSGQASDLSSDSETCSKSSTKCDVTCFENVVRNQNLQKKLQRRESADSCQTSSSAYTDHGNTSNDNQVSLICQRWARMKKFEHDEEVLMRRRKQIDYGKSTIGYQLYRKEIPRDKRKSEDPQTPNKHLKYSRRAFDGLIKIRRKKLHQFDPYDPSESFSSSDQSDQCEAEC